jgi:integrase
VASLQERKGSFRVIFRYHGKQHFVTIGSVSRDEAESKAAQVDYLLMRLKQGLIDIPHGVSVVDFVLHDGKPPAGQHLLPTEKVLSLVAFRDRYLATHRQSLEARTIEGIELHFKHLIGALGVGFPIRELKLTDLQGYVDGRAKAKGTGGKRLSPATIRKEIISLRTAWNWAAKIGIVVGRFPYDGLRYPKMFEKPPFQTHAEIERQIAGGGLTAHQQKELWHALYLQKAEIEEALAVVRQSALHGWIYAMAATAAYTGARRSELIRMRPADIDLAGNTVIVREKKRVRGQHTTRRVPLTGFLADVLREYLKSHPGGQALFCHARDVGRSKKRSGTTGHQSGDGRAGTIKGRLATVRDREQSALGPLTEDEVHDHLKRALRGSRWAVIKGWHVWRHAFISACASQGVDQRFIDEWVGHQSEAMKRRYRHLAPSVQADALKGVFG